MENFERTNSFSSYKKESHTGQSGQCGSNRNETINQLLFFIIVIVFFSIKFFIMESSECGATHTIASAMWVVLTELV